MALWTNRSCGQICRDDLIRKRKNYSIKILEIYSRFCSMQFDHLCLILFSLNNTSLFYFQKNKDIWDDAWKWSLHMNRRRMWDLKLLNVICHSMKKLDDVLLFDTVRIVYCAVDCRMENILRIIQAQRFTWSAFRDKKTLFFHQWPRLGDIHYKVKHQTSCVHKTSFILLSFAGAERKNCTCLIRFFSLT